MSRPLAALALAAGLALGADPAFAQMQAPCRDVLALSDWRSDFSDRGYWAASFMMRNIATREVVVTVTPSGPGAVIAQPVTLQPGQSAKVWPYRTTARMAPSAIQSGVTLICAIAIPTQFPTVR
ncbi:MAG: hypothetical protein K2X11_10790 [Acetobacteraceae bacterium]|nr:hypothetical protein [Acetobacteraceae bacterium]